MQGRSHLYIYDEFLSERKYERQLAAIEGRLASLDLSGATTRLSMLRGTRELVTSQVKDEITTVVIVGDDHTVDALMWFLPDLPVTVAYIPLRAPHHTADLLGIPSGLEACDVLAARKIETLDIGILDERYFLGEVSAAETMADVEVPGEFHVRAIAGGSIQFKNLGADAHDGQLDLVIRPREEKSGWGRRHEMQETRLQVRQAILSSADPIEIQVDHQVVRGQRFQVGIVPNKLKFITGRTRGAFSRKG